MTTRIVSWGDALLVAAVKAPGGLNQTVERIRRVLGPQIGTRNSFSKLYKLDPEDMKATDKWRAWVLLTAIGEDPASWGLLNDVVPEIFASRIEDLRHRLCAPRDSNPEPTGYGTGRLRALNPRARRAPARPTNRSRNTGPKNRAA